MIRTLALAALTASALALPAAAADFKVEVNATDTNTAAGAQRVLAQAERDAARICRENGVRRTSDVRRFERICAADVVAQIVATVDRPMLTAAYEGSATTVRFASNARVSQR